MFITTFSGRSSESNPQLCGVKHSHAKLSWPLLVAACYFFVKQVKSLYKSKKGTYVLCVLCRSVNFAGITVMLLASPKIFVIRDFTTEVFNLSRNEGTVNISGSEPAYF